MIATQQKRRPRRFVPSLNDETGSRLEGRSLTTLFRRTLDPGILAQVRGIWGGPLVFMTDTSAAPHKSAIALSTGAAPVPSTIGASASGSANNQVIDGGSGGVHGVNVNVALQNSCTVTTPGFPMPGFQNIWSEADSGITTTGGALGPAIFETFYDNSNVNPTPGPFVVTGTFTLTYTPPPPNSSLRAGGARYNIQVSDASTGVPILDVTPVRVVYTAPNGAGGFAVYTVASPPATGGTVNVNYSAPVGGGVTIAYGSRVDSAANPLVVGGAAETLSWHLDCFVP